jgi:hypothetical protein
MMRAALHTAACVAVFALGGAAFGQAHIYSCKDASGHTITSDRPIPECADRTMEERSKGGTVLREITPPLTPAQQRQLEADEKKKHELAEAEREQQRRDQALLTNYSSEKDIDSARARALEDYQDAIAKAQERLKLLYEDRTANQKEAANYKGQTVPYSVQGKIDLTEAQINSENQTIADRKVDIERINHRFDADLERFRVLTKGTAKN